MSSSPGGISSAPPVSPRAGVQRHAARPATRLRIAVVVPTYRRPELLRRCLAALVAQDIDPGAIEIVVVDDGPTADTRAAVAAVAAATGGAPPVRYLVNTAGKGPAAARNVGWQATVAPLVAFTDDDTIPAPGWLAAAETALDGEAAAGIGAVCGRVVVPVQGRPTDHARMTQGLATAEFVTANAIVRRTALQQVGGFDTRFTRAWREDSDLQFALIEAGWTVGRADAAVVEHPVRPAPWGISLRQQANVVFDALLYRKHPQLYRERVRRRPPWHYLGIVAATLGALSAWALHAPLTAAALAAVALAGIARFAARRLRGASRAPAHVAEMLVTSCAIPFLAVYWRAVGAWRYRTLFP